MGDPWWVILQGIWQSLVQERLKTGQLFFWCFFGGTNMVKHLTDFKSVCKSDTWLCLKTSIRHLCDVWWCMYELCVLPLYIIYVHNMICIMYEYVFLCLCVQCMYIYIYIVIWFKQTRYKCADLYMYICMYDVHICIKLCISVMNIIYDIYIYYIDIYNTYACWFIFGVFCWKTWGIWCVVKLILCQLLWIPMAKCLPSASTIPTTGYQMHRQGNPPKCGLKSG